jgi:hypothetical protein
MSRLPVSWISASARHCVVYRSFFPAALFSPLFFAFAGIAFVTGIFFIV